MAKVSLSCVNGTVTQVSSILVEYNVDGYCAGGRNVKPSCPRAHKARGAVSERNKKP